MTTPSELERSIAPRGSWFKTYGRWLLLAVGIVIVGVLIRNVGYARLWIVLRGSGVWLPPIIALEIVMAVLDLWGIRAIAGRKASEIPPADWLRSSLIAYACMILLPAGRAAGELARAAVLSKSVGAARATAWTTRLFAISLIAVGLTSLALSAVLLTWFGPSENLVRLLGLNAVAALACGVGVLAAAAHVRMAGWLARLVRRISPGVEIDIGSESVKRTWRAALLALTTARVLQTFQYGLIVLAVGGTLTVKSSAMAQGIHLLGASVGDVIPNQVGVLEGAYRLFADILGFSASPERALAIALLARAAQLSLSLLCLAAFSILGRGERAAATP